MGTDVQLFYLFLFTVLFLAAMIVATMVSRKVSLLRSGYKLYAIRDDLIWLVAQGKVEEDDPVFQMIYGAANETTQILEQLSLKTLVNALKDRTDELQRERERFLQGLHQRDPELTLIFARFGAEISRILWINSILLRLLVRSHWIYSIARRVYHSLDLRRT